MYHQKVKHRIICLAKGTQAQVYLIDYNDFSLSGSLFE